MKILNVLKAMGGFALKLVASNPQVAANLVGNAVLGPVWSVLITNVVSSVFSAEEAGVSGDAKKATATKLLSVSAPGLIKLFESTTGRELADDEALMKSFDQYLDATVALMNAFRLLPKKDEPSPEKEKKNA